MLNRHPEYQYLDLLQQVLEHGDRRIDRTGVGTLSIFGAMARFDVSDSRADPDNEAGVLENRDQGDAVVFDGKTNIQDLLKENVRIWTDWPLARYRKETGETSAGGIRKRIVQDEPSPRAGAISGQSMASNGVAGRGRTAVNSIRSPASSTLSKTTRPAGASCSMAGTSPKSIRWRCPLPYGLSVSRLQGSAVVPLAPAQRGRPARKPF